MKYFISISNQAIYAHPDAITCPTCGQTITCNGNFTEIARYYCQTCDNNSKQVRKALDEYTCPFCGEHVARQNGATCGCGKTTVHALLDTLFADDGDTPCYKANADIPRTNHLMKSTNVTPIQFSGFVHLLMESHYGERPHASRSGVRYLLDRNVTEYPHHHATYVVVGQTKDGRTRFVRPATRQDYEKVLRKAGVQVSPDDTIEMS